MNNEKSPFKNGLQGASPDFKKKLPSLKASTKSREHAR